MHIVEEGNTIISSLQKSGKNLIIFRESLDEGIIDKNIGSDTFWKKRYAYFEAKGVSKLEYFDDTIKPLAMLQDIPQKATLFLWFSAEEKSQINKVGLMAYLLDYYRKDITYYSVLANEKQDLENLLENKERLSRNKLLDAKNQWFSFVEKRGF